MNDLTPFFKRINGFHFLPQGKATSEVIPELMEGDDTYRLFIYGIADFFEKKSKQEQVQILDICLKVLTQKIDGDNDLSPFFPPEEWTYQNISLFMGIVSGLRLVNYENIQALHMEEAEKDLIKISDTHFFFAGKSSCDKFDYSPEAKFLIATTLRSWLHEQEVPHNKGFILIEYLSRIFAIECLEEMESSYDFQIVFSSICRYLWYSLHDISEDFILLQNALIDIFGEPSSEPNEDEDEFMDIPSPTALRYLLAAQSFMKDCGSDKLYPELYMLLGQQRKEILENE